MVAAYSDVVAVAQTPAVAELLPVADQNCHNDIQYKYELHLNRQISKQEIESLSKRKLDNMIYDNFS